MKKIFLSTLTVFMAVSISAQFNFSVSPGINLNGASFGYKVQKFVPYLGFQVYNLKSEVNDYGKEYDFNGDIVDYKSTLSIGLTVLMPTIGAKYYFIEKNKLRAYGNLNFTKVILSGKVDGDYLSNSYKESIRNTIKDTKIFASQIGFGTEYFFDENFSLGGEFGFSYFNLNRKTESKVILNDQNTGNDVVVTNVLEVKSHAIPTYSRISLNFYF